MELWTNLHIKTLLPSMLIMAVVALILGKCLAKRSFRVRMLPFQVLAVFLFILEIFKQLISFSQGYDLYHIPLHFCSLFIFMLPLMAFYRGKHENGIRAITVGLCAAVFAIMCVYPSLIYSAWDIEHFFDRFFAFHTVVFHNIVILEFFLIITLRLYHPRSFIKDVRPLTFFMMGYCLVGSVAAQLLKTNFNNFYTCNIAPLEAVRLAVEGALGYVPAQILYVLVVSTLDLVVTALTYWVFRLFYRLTAPIPPSKEQA